MFNLHFSKLLWEVKLLIFGIISPKTLTLILTPVI